MSEQAVSLDESDGPFSRLFQPFMGALVAGHDKNLPFWCFPVSKRDCEMVTNNVVYKTLFVWCVSFGACWNVGSGDIERSEIMYV